jgi:hypothetical protein
VVVADLAEVDYEYPYGEGDAEICCSSASTAPPSPTLGRPA